MISDTTRTPEVLLRAFFDVIDNPSVVNQKPIKHWSPRVDPAEELHVWRAIEYFHHKIREILMSNLQGPYPWYLPDRRDHIIWEIQRSSLLKYIPIRMFYSKNASCMALLKERLGIYQHQPILPRIRTASVEPMPDDE
jgi:hypothetical protein